MKKLIALFIMAGLIPACTFAEITAPAGGDTSALATTNDLSALDTAYKAADSNLQNQVDGKASLVSTTNTFYNGTNQVWRLTTLTNGIALEVWNTVSNAFVRQTEWTED